MRIMTHGLDSSGKLPFWSKWILLTKQNTSSQWRPSGSGCPEAGLCNLCPANSHAACLELLCWEVALNHFLDSKHLARDHVCHKGPGT